MVRLGTFAALLLLSGIAIGDELILKEGGKVVEFRVLKDTGDSIEVQTLDAKILTIAKKDIKEVRLITPTAPLTGATFTGDSTKGGKPANLLALIKPKEQGSGEWKFVAGALTGKNGTLEVPHIPTGSYDVELTVERREGTSDFMVGLVALGKPFCVMFDCGNGSYSGLSAVDGRRVTENETRVNGKVFAPRKVVKIACAVRQDCVVVLLDGKEFLNWKGDPKRLSRHDRPEKSQNLFICVPESTFSITQYMVTSRN